MKKLLSLLLLVTNISFAVDTVEIINPVMNGHPFEAVRAKDTFFGLYGERDFKHAADLACQLAGYNQADWEGTKVGLIAQDDTRYYRVKDFIMDDVEEYTPDRIYNWMRGGRPNRWGHNYHEEPLFSIIKRDIVRSNGRVKNINPKRLRRVDDCEVASICRSHRAGFINVVADPHLDMTSPFVRQCHDWGRGSRNTYVFTKLKCENVSTNPDIVNFHIATQNRYKIVASQEENFPTRLENPEVACNTPLARGGVQDPGIGSCDATPWLSRGGPAPIFDMSNLMMVMIATGRERRWPTNMPTCARRIIDKYSDIFLNKSQNIGQYFPNHTYANFCVDSVSEVRTSNASCSLEIASTDVLGMKRNVTIEKFTQESAECQELKSCLETPALACESTNFCPPLGVRQDSEMNLPTYDF